MIDEHEILKDILVDESELIQNLASIIQKAKDIFVIEKESGKIIFKKYSILTNPQKISCILIGKYFAKRLGIVENDAITSSELSLELEIPQTTLSSPLKSLRKINHILYDEPRYRINPHRIEEIVDTFFKNDQKLSQTRKNKQNKK